MVHHRRYIDKIILFLTEEKTMDFDYGERSESREMNDLEG
jgi:hypothetical protein